MRGYRGVQGAARSGKGLRAVKGVDVSIRRCCTTVIAAMAILLVASSAIAAPAVQTGEMHVQIWPGAVAGQAVVITSVELTATTPLPAVVRIPLVPGTKVDWAGEILGSGAQDVKREYKVKEGTGAQYAEFTISQSRLAQIELSGLALTVQGTATSVSVPYAQSVPAPLTGFSVRVPAAVSSVKINPAPAGEPQRNQLGESLYTLPNKELEVGDKATVTVSYAVGSSEASPTTAGTAPQGGTIIAALLVGIAVALLALVLVVRRQNQARA